MNIRKIAFSVFLSSAMLASQANAQGQGSPASERMCFLLGGFAGAIADEKDKGTKMEELMPLMEAVSNVDARNDQRSILKLIYEKKLSGSDARKEIYFRCMVGDYKSAWKL